MDSRKIIRLLEEDGWYKAGQRGSHLQFIHPLKKGRVTVVHPRKDIPLKTLISIEKQSGLKLR
jgi:predicted RNA binding protein YcfA (HicA-like mRNA interferase family)